jgi:hypothetical protein
MLTVGGMVETARYPHTAKILQFGGRFDSEGVDLARIHIPQLSLSDCGEEGLLLRCLQASVAVERSRGRATYR